MKKRIVGLMVVIVMIMGLIPVVPMKVEAANPIDINIGTIVDGTSGDGYTFSSHTLTITGVGPYVITGTTTTNHIVVSGGSGVISNITLNGVDIQFSDGMLWGSAGTCAMEINNNSKAKITLVGTSVIKSGHQVAGLGISLGNELIIGEESTGSLTATGGYYGAGIGGGMVIAGGNVTISGGMVTARGGANAAGIGGGDTGAGGNVTISGGIVTATGGNQGAGIGGGFGRSGGTNTIIGGSVLADSIANAPISSSSSLVYLTTLTIPSYVSEGASCSIMVDNVDFHIPVVPIGNKVYLYLPVATHDIDITSGSKNYEVSVEVAGNDANVGTVNAVQVGTSASVTTLQDQAITGSVSATDEDSADEAELLYAQGTGPIHGTLVLNFDGTYTYTPDEDYTGLDSFTFTANDGKSTSAPQTVSISISPTYRVTYHINNGSGTAPVDTHKYLSGASVTLPSNSGFTRPHLSFLGWSTSPTATTAITGSYTMASANTTLYAVWKEDTKYTVTYNLNGGSGNIPVDASLYYSGDTVNLLSGNVTLYALWQANPVVNATTEASTTLDATVTKTTPAPTVITTTTIAGGNVLVTAVMDNGVETGDKSPLNLVILVLILSATGIIVVIVVSKKKKIGK